MTRAQELIDMAQLRPPATPFNWAQVEQRIGAPVPQDYRELIDAGRRRALAGQPAAPHSWMDRNAVFTAYGDE